MEDLAMRAALLLGLSVTACPCLGDTVLTAIAEVNGTRSQAMTAPVAGTYRFLFGHDRAEVSSPNGKRFLIDFVKRTFTSVDPAARTYYEAEIPSVLAVGDRLRASDSGSKIKGKVTFEPTHADSPQPDLARPAKNYRVQLESNLIESSGSPAGFGGSVSSRGGVSFGGLNNVEHSSWIGRRSLEGEFWMADTPAGLDADQVNTAIECVLLWGQPQLSELTRRIHDSKLAIFGADFSLKVEEQRNVVVPPPLISIKVTSISDGTLDESSLTLPSDYRRVSPPAGPMGG